MRALNRPPVLPLQQSHLLSTRDEEEDASTPREQWGSFGAHKTVESYEDEVSTPRDHLGPTSITQSRLSGYEHQMQHLAFEKAIMSPGWARERTPSPENYFHPSLQYQGTPNKMPGKPAMRMDIEASVHQQAVDWHAPSHGRRAPGYIPSPEPYMHPLPLYRAPVQEAVHTNHAYVDDDIPFEKYPREHVEDSMAQAQGYHLQAPMSQHAVHAKVFPRNDQQNRNARLCSQPEIGSSWQVAGRLPTSEPAKTQQPNSMLSISQHVDQIQAVPPPPAPVGIRRDRNAAKTTLSIDALVQSNSNVVPSTERYNRKNAFLQQIVNNGSPLVSVGSVGHPHCCGEPCKYASKPRGCKDGAQCKRCHICKWTRHNAPAGSRS
jgi:hypothetical protein